MLLFLRELNSKIFKICHIF